MGLVTEEMARMARWAIAGSAFVVAPRNHHEPHLL